MELLQERTIETYDAGLAEQHNAMIKERYRKLQNAEADQFAKDSYTNDNAQPAFFVEENVSAVVEQQEQNSARSTAPIFTAEKFDRMQGFTQESAYTQTMATPVTTVKPVSVAAVEERYGLTPLAKILMAVFTLIIVAMISLISVNTQIIQQKKIKIQNLEQKKERLMEQNEEIQRRIQEAQSDDAIRQYAESKGMVQLAQ